MVWLTLLMVAVALVCFALGLWAGSYNPERDQKWYMNGYENGMRAAKWMEDSRRSTVVHKSGVELKSGK